MQGTGLMEDNAQVLEGGKLRQGVIPNMPLTRRIKDHHLRLGVMRLTCPTIISHGTQATRP